MQPRGHHERSHLVAIADVALCDERLRLRISAADIEETPLVEVSTMTKVGPPAGYRDRSSRLNSPVSAWEQYPYAGSWVGSSGTDFGSGYSTADRTGPRYVAAKFDRVPDKAIEVGRSSQVVGRDKHAVGSIDGFIFDDDGSITHLVLERGHLLRHLNIMIPIAHVTRFGRTNLRLDVSRHDVGQFPAEKYHRYAH